MSKAYKGGLCAYCCEAEATTADHVIARGFFPAEKRGNLPKVGACRKCNNDKSTLEHALTAVMPFGAQHSGAAAALAGVEPKLAKNQRLHRWLAEGVRYILRSVNGSPWRQEMTVPIEGRDLERLAEFIVKGLARHHWNLHVGHGHFVRASFLNEEGRMRFDPFFRGKVRDRVYADLGDGAFTYEGIQSDENPEITLWQMSLYRAEVEGDPKALGQRASIIYGVTVPAGAKAAQMLAQILANP